MGDNHVKKEIERLSRDVERLEERERAAAIRIAVLSKDIEKLATRVMSALGLASAITTAVVVKFINELVI